MNTTGVTSGAGTAYHSGAQVFTPGFYWGSYYPIFSFMCMFCRSLFVLLYFFFCPLCCLYFFDTVKVLIFATSNFRGFSQLDKFVGTCFLIFLNLNNIYLENNQNIQYIKHSKYRQDSETSNYCFYMFSGLVWFAYVLLRKSKKNVLFGQPVYYTEKIKSYYVLHLSSEICSLCFILTGS
jgi:hypothetical protein